MQTLQDPKLEASPKRPFKRLDHNLSARGDSGPHREAEGGDS